MKKLLLLLFAVCTALGSYAYDVCVDGIYYNLDVTNKTAEVTSGDQQYIGSVVIPQSITIDSDSYSVTTIGAHSFAYCTSLTSIIIPNSVTTIGNCAFWVCTSLTSIIIPNSVTSIGLDSFDNCM